MRKIILALVLFTLAACQQSTAGADSEEPLPRYSEESEITVYTYDRVFYRYTDHKYNVVCYRYLTDEYLVCLPLLGPTE
jgi:hypothetical protein